MLIILLCMLIAPIRADREIRLVSFGCSTSPYNEVTVFEKKLNVGLLAVLENVVPSKFATKDVVVGTDLADSVYALVQCRKDMSSADCVNCIKVADKQVRNCFIVTLCGGRATYDGCFLHYENSIFYSLYIDANAPTSNLFSATARSLISDFRTATPQINGYFAAQTRQFMHLPPVCVLFKGIPAKHA